MLIKQRINQRSNSGDLFKHILIYLFIDIDVFGDLILFLPLIGGIRLAPVLGIGVVGGSRGR